MAKEITIEQVEAKLLELAGKYDKLNQLKDGEQILVESAKLQKDAAQFEALVQAYDQQEKAKAAAYVEPPPKIIKVELTDEQRQRVLDQTGVRIEVVELVDGEDVELEDMPEETRPNIEKKAIEKAEAMKLQAAADEQAKAEALAAIEEITKQNNPELNKIIGEQMKDPDSLGGLLGKG